MFYKSKEALNNDEKRVLLHNVPNLPGKMS